MGGLSSALKQPGEEVVSCTKCTCWRKGTILSPKEKSVFCADFKKMNLCLIFGLPCQNW